MKTDILVRRLYEHAFALGFDQIGICKANLPDHYARQLREFVHQKRYGDMNWMKEKLDIREHPKNLWPEVRSVIVVAVNYGPENNPMINLQHNDIGNISVYARHRDYHDIIKGWLKHLAQFLIKEAKAIYPDIQVKVFVDTAPIMEKPLAMQAGIGWQGKHTNIVSRQFGSWLFLGEIFTTLELPAVESSTMHCGQCTRCLDICPTQAFIAPYQLDARRCISYLTIEHEGSIPIEYRQKIGNRIYGCDDCLAICPWNRFAKNCRHIKLQPRTELNNPLLAELAQLNEEEFRRFFSGSPIKRIGHTRFIRNILIALGNSKNITLLPSIKRWLNHPDPVIQETANWAEKTIQT